MTTTLPPVLRAHGNFKIDTQQNQMHGEALERGRADVEEAAVLVNRLERSNRRGQALGHHLGGGKQPNARAARRRLE